MRSGGTRPAGWIAASSSAAQRSTPLAPPAAAAATSTAQAGCCHSISTSRVAVSSAVRSRGRRASAQCAAALPQQRTAAANHAAVQQRASSRQRSARWEGGAHKAPQPWRHLPHQQSRPLRCPLRRRHHDRAQEPAAAERPGPGGLQSAQICVARKRQQRLDAQTDHSNGSGKERSSEIVLIATRFVGCSKSMRNRGGATGGRASRPETPRRFSLSFRRQATQASTITAGLRKKNNYASLCRPRLMRDAAGARPKRKRPKAVSRWREGGRLQKHTLTAPKRAGRRKLKTIQPHRRRLRRVASEVTPQKFEVTRYSRSIRAPVEANEVKQASASLG